MRLAALLKTRVETSIETSTNPCLKKRSAFHLASNRAGTVYSYASRRRRPAAMEKVSTFRQAKPPAMVLYGHHLDGRKDSRWNALDARENSSTTPDDARKVKVAGMRI